MALLAYTIFGHFSNFLWWFNHVVSHDSLTYENCHTVISTTLYIVLLECYVFWSLSYFYVSLFMYILLTIMSTNKYEYKHIIMSLSRNLKSMCYWHVLYTCINVEPKRIKWHEGSDVNNVLINSVGILHVDVTTLDVTVQNSGQSSIP